VYMDLVELALKYNVIAQAGAWFTIMSDAETGEILMDAEGNIAKFNGKSKLIEYLKSDQEVFNYLYELLLTKLAE